MLTAAIPACATVCLTSCSAALIVASAVRVRGTEPDARRRPNSYVPRRLITAKRRRGPPVESSNQAQTHVTSRPMIEPQLPNDPHTGSRHEHAAGEQFAGGSAQNGAPGGLPVPVSAPPMHGCTQYCVGKHVTLPHMGLVPSDGVTSLTAASVVSGPVQANALRASAKKSAKRFIA